jgi:hypothetical protein
VDQCISSSKLHYRLSSISTPLFIQKNIEHSQSKDKYLRVALKRLIETQLFEDELKEVSEFNKVLLTQNQELETQLVEESREKAGK